MTSGWMTSGVRRQNVKERYRKRETYRHESGKDLILTQAAWNKTDGERKVAVIVIYFLIFSLHSFWEANPINPQEDRARKAVTETKIRLVLFQIRVN